MDYNKKLEELRQRIENVIPNTKPSFFSNNFLENKFIIIISSIISLMLLLFFLIKKPGIILNEKGRISFQKIILWMIIVIATIFFGLQLYYYKMK